MAALVNYNYSTNYAEFSVDSEDELVTLPTTSRPGSGELANVGAVTAGSIACTTSGDLEVYTLGAGDTWNRR